jgi:hypothetical protein
MGLTRGARGRCATGIITHALRVKALETLPAHHTTPRIAFLVFCKMLENDKDLKKIKK